MRVAPVSNCRTVTDAPCSAAPVPSRTTPVIVPPTIWAPAIAAPISRSIKTEMRNLPMNVTQPPESLSVDCLFFLRLGEISCAGECAQGQIRWDQRQQQQAVRREADTWRCEEGRTFFIIPVKSHRSSEKLSVLNEHSFSPAVESN